MSEKDEKGPRWAYKKIAPGGHRLVDETEEPAVDEPVRSLENDLELFETGMENAGKRQVSEALAANSDRDSWMWFRVGEVVGQLMRKVSKLERRVVELERK